MTKNESESLIARLAFKNAALEDDNQELRARMDSARRHIICIGGPLNDNKLGYSKEQLVTFQRIVDDLEG